MRWVLGDLDWLWLIGVWVCGYWGLGCLLFISWGWCGVSELSICVRGRLVLFLLWFGMCFGCSVGVDCKGSKSIMSVTWMWDCA